MRVHHLRRSALSAGKASKTNIQDEVYASDMRLSFPQMLGDLSGLWKTYVETLCHMGAFRSSEHTTMAAALPTFARLVGKSLVQRARPGRHPPVAWIYYSSGSIMPTGGTVHLKQANAAPKEHRWTLKVNSKFMINVTFTEFYQEYSMHRCSRESVTVSGSFGSSLVYCGHRYLSSYLTASDY